MRTMPWMMRKGTPWASWWGPLVDMVENEGALTGTEAAGEVQSG